MSDDRSSGGYCLLDSGIGPVGLAWSDLGLTHLQLPERSRAATEARLRRSAGPAARKAVPARIEPIVEALRDYFAGRRVSFAAMPLDLSEVSDFQRLVYDAARAVDWGRTATYGEIARGIGAPGAARGVGQALGRNPLPIVVPCHRILASGGKIGGFSAYGGGDAKVRLLALEGVHLDGGTPLLPGLLPYPAARADLT